MTPPTLNVPASVLDGCVGFIELTSVMTKRAFDEIGVHRQAQEKAAQLRPPLLAHMIKTQVVQPHQKQAAEAMLSSHAETLSLLKAAVDKIAEHAAEIARLKGGSAKAGGDLGAGVDDGPQPGEYNSLTSPMVGEKTANVKESDKPLLRLIGR